MTTPASPAGGVDGGVYHERQRLQLCAVHAINNLLQDPAACTAKHLDAVSHEFAPDVWFNPHKSCLGLGNYDANVLMAHLARCGCDTEWWDARKNAAGVSPPLTDPSVVGVILNRRLRGWTFGILAGSHWSAVTSVNGTFYDVDSKLPAPRPLGTAADAAAHLQATLAAAADTHMLVVRKHS